ncbi:phosphotransferase [Bacillus sp. 2205SS5-2]|uniref:phosphotransferase n=1 Tax=Bacillus sp. 2205SS5-2 TaxID=3109031 RepID=UPI0030058EF3
MISKGNWQGDDFDNRLLLFIKKELGTQDVTISKLKNGKWLMEIDENKWFVKEYRSEEHLLTQLLLTNKLDEDEFPFVVKFHPLHFEKTLLFEGNYFALYHWLESTPFYYHQYKDREKALEVLSVFHENTSSYIDELHTYLPSYDLLGKWIRRQREFTENLPFFSLFIPEHMLSSFTYWGTYSLQNLEESKRQWENRQECIVHGDVAHHNFIKSKEENCYLIDFDLIATAPKMVDDLQLSNRFLQAMEWKVESLWQHKSLTSYQTDLPFLYGLIYPTDVYREWNRFRKASHENQRRVWPYLYRMTFQYYHNRMRGVQIIEEMIRTLEEKGK